MDCLDWPDTFSVNTSIFLKIYNALKLRFKQKGVGWGEKRKAYKPDLMMVISKPVEKLIISGHVYLLGRYVMMVWMFVFSSLNEFLGCMSFGLRHLTNPKKEVNGWYYLLTEDIGRKKHLQVSHRQRPQLKLRSKYRALRFQVHVCLDVTFTCCCILQVHSTLFVWYSTFMLASLPRLGSVKNLHKNKYCFRT